VPRWFAPLVVGVVVGVVAWTGGWLVGAEQLGEFDSIEPIRVSTFYGTARGLNGDGRYCIDDEDDGVVCAVLRVDEDLPMPRNGELARGGIGDLPSDSSDLPESSWLWVTPMACPLEPTDCR
jgi:hypothetical protein